MIISENNLMYTTKSFSDKKEGERYFEAQRAKGRLQILNTHGDTFNVIKSISSLSKKVVFCLGYESYTPVDDCLILVSEKLDCWVVQVEDYLFYIKPSQSYLSGSFQPSTPISCLYIWESQLLVIEEAGVTITDMDSSVIKQINTDLIGNISLAQSSLLVETIEGEQLTINLK